MSDKFLEFWKRSGYLPLHPGDSVRHIGNVLKAKDGFDYVFSIEKQLIPQDSAFFTDEVMQDCSSSAFRGDDSTEIRKKLEASGVKTSNMQLGSGKVHDLLSEGVVSISAHVTVAAPVPGVPGATVAFNSWFAFTRSNSIAIRAEGHFSAQLYEDGIEEKKIKDDLLAKAGGKVGIYFFVTGRLFAYHRSYHTGNTGGFSISPATAQVDFAGIKADLGLELKQSSACTIATDNNQCCVGYTVIPYEISKKIFSRQRVVKQVPRVRVTGFQMARQNLSNLGETFDEISEETMETFETVETFETLEITRISQDSKDIGVQFDPLPPTKLAEFRDRGRRKSLDSPDRSKSRDDGHSRSPPRSPLAVGGPSSGTAPFSHRKHTWLALIVSNCDCPGRTTLGNKPRT